MRKGSGVILVRNYFSRWYDKNKFSRRRFTAHVNLRLHAALTTLRPPPTHEVSENFSPYDENVMKSST